jgi:hypothetical protein
MQRKTPPKTIMQGQYECDCKRETGLETEQKHGVGHKANNKLDLLNVISVCLICKERNRIGHMVETRFWM